MAHARIVEREQEGRVPALVQGTDLDRSVAGRRRRGQGLRLRQVRGRRGRGGRTACAAVAAAAVGTARVLLAPFARRREVVALPDADVVDLEVGREERRVERVAFPAADLVLELDVGRHVHHALAPERPERLAVSVHRDFAGEPEHAHRDEALRVRRDVVRARADDLVLLAVAVPVAGGVEAVRTPHRLRLDDVDLHAAVEDVGAAAEVHPVLLRKALRELAEPAVGHEPDAGPEARTGRELQAELPVAVALRELAERVRPADLPVGLDRRRRRRPGELGLLGVVVVEAALPLRAEDELAVAEEDAVAAEVLALVPEVEPPEAEERLVDLLAVELVVERLRPLAGDGRTPPQPVGLLRGRVLALHAQDREALRPRLRVGDHR